MKNLLNNLLLLCVTTSALLASQNGIYIEAVGGVDLSDTQESIQSTYVYEKSFIGSVAVGYQLDTLSFEFQERYKKANLYSVSSNDSYSIAVDGDVISSSHMFNAYYSGYNSSKLVSSIGFGAGVSNIELSDSAKDDSVLSLQGLVGVGYRVTENFTTTLKYSYFYTTSSDNFQANNDSSLSLSLKYLF